MRIMKIKRNTKQLGEMLNKWLKIYLPNTRLRSKNTVDAYESALSLYLDFLEYKKKITETDLNEECFQRLWIEEWIGEAHNERHNSRRTCDLRLSCIRSLLKYLSSKNMLFLPYYIDAKNIEKVTRGHGKQVEGLSKEATRVLFGTMTTSNMTCYRDYALFTLMYDTGARISEAISVTIKDVNFNTNPPQIIVRGKGDKIRALFLSPETVKLLRSYIGEAHGSHPQPDSYVFYSRLKGKVSPVSVDAINCRLKVYAAKAHEICPEIPKDFHTHQLRHTACTHWHHNPRLFSYIILYIF